MFAFLFSCQPTKIAYINETIPEFSLMDYNSTSSTFESSVSTTDFPEMVSAWYFGHST